MLRLIGKGSYGEVWLARSVTGAMRAVKVVHRSDFQHDKTFEREFEGLKKFEPISRSHPGLVDVLHVGRNLTEGFYYYVMELGDDQVRGSEIIPELYVARTLSSDINQRDHGRLGVDECIDAGANLADALEYLHERGLTHRDVKPSNVIFVEGVAKLADIGLVAASGQRTFVGTEGFVPPEGPGSPAADIYSLGMVLYEVSTGNDRLEFPELPSRLPDESERPKWRALNAIVCKACAQKPKDRFAAAADFAQALLRVKAGRVRRKTLRGRLFRTGLWAGLLATLILFTRHRDVLQAVQEGEEMMLAIAERDGNGTDPVPFVPDSGQSGDPPNSGTGETVDEPPNRPPEVPEKDKVGRVRILSDPMVEVHTLEGEYLDRIGDSGVKEWTDIPIGPVSFVLKREGYAPQQVDGVVEEGGTLELYGELKVFKPPVEGQPWENSFKMAFAWFEGVGHVARLPVMPAMYRQFRQEMGATHPFMQGKVSFPDPQLTAPVDAVMVTKEGGQAFCDWLTEKSRAAGYFSAEHSYVLNEFVEYEPGPMGEPEGEGEAEDLMLLMCAVEQSEVAFAEFESVPPGVEIWHGKERLGTTVDRLRIEPGPIRLTFRSPGYQSLELDLELKAGETLQRRIELEKSNAAVFGLRWKNSLGMEFVPLGGELLFGAHEVTVENFREFTTAKGLEWVHTPPYQQGDDHPVVKVSREDAEAFCEWLTEVETEGGRLQDGAAYRLPMDLEWSKAAGLAPEGGITPAARDGQIKGEYPWGDQWPPVGRPANLADAASLPRNEKSIAGYDDGFKRTSPVGSFPPNQFGIYDLSGNVWEWVAEPYRGGRLKAYGVVRGGCFANALPRELESSCRNPLRVTFRDVLYGFRVVIAKSVDPEEELDE